VRIVVSAASKHGSTAQIAARIGEVLRVALPAGAVVEVNTAAELSELMVYDAIVLGRAVYMGRWLPGAREGAAAVAAHPLRPVWLFSSGPVGDPPKPDEDPSDVSDLMTSTHARGHRLLAGRLDRHLLGFAEKAMVMALRVPDGDFRDWDAIEAWATQIAAELREPADSPNR
jgi:menaquinone-dependent protoporphyrinogen oxidase